jgi:hypothetical protein
MTAALAGAVLLGGAALCRAQVTFTEDQDIAIATGADIAFGDVKIHADQGIVDIAYRGNDLRVYYKLYTVGGTTTAAQQIDPDNHTGHISGIGRHGDKLKIGYHRYANLCEATRDAYDHNATWNRVDTGYDGVSAGASSSYAVNPVTGLGGFVARASGNSAYYIADQGAGSWGGFTTVLDAGSGNIYPDLVYGADGTPYVGSNYGYVSAVGPAPWAGAVGDLRRVHTTTAYNSYHNALAERNGTRYFVNVRTNSEAKLYATNAQGDWVYDSLITNKGYSGDSLEIAMAVSPTGKIAVLLYDQKVGDTGCTLYLATKDGLGGGYAWQWNRLAQSGQKPDVKYDKAGNLFIAYYDPADDTLHLKTTTYITTPEAHRAVGEEPEDIGDGEHNDNAAFHAAGAAILAHGSGALRLDGTKTYIIGGQTTDPGSTTKYYQYIEPFYVLNTATPQLEGVWVNVIGNDSRVEKVPGIHLGAFDPVTGAAMPNEPPKNEDGSRVYPYNLGYYWCNAGYMFAFDSCDSVRVQDLTIDGNCDLAVPGGRDWRGGLEQSGSNLHFNKCQSIYIDNVVSTHSTLDGLYLRADDIVEGSPARVWRVTNSNFAFNLRQGMSVISSVGLYVANCKFNHTGKGGLSTSPAAGVDMEPNDLENVNRDGTFVNCEFVNNNGSAVAVSQGNNADFTFKDCLIWGTQYYAVTGCRPGLRYEDCTFHGTVLNPYGAGVEEEANQFYRCHFEDKIGTYTDEFGVWNLASFPGTAVLTHETATYIGDGVLFSECTFICNNYWSIDLLGPNTEEKIIDCTFIFKCNYPLNGGNQARLRGAYIENTQFLEEISFPPGEPTYNYKIEANSSTLGPGVYVEGPYTHWMEVNGPQGWITQPE